MKRLAELSVPTAGSENSCSRRLCKLLAETALPKTIRKDPQTDDNPGQMITHHLPPTNVIRLIHSYNRRKFAHIFGANKSKLEAFWSGLFRTDEGKQFKALHPILREKEPEQLQTSKVASSVAGCAMQMKWPNKTRRESANTRETKFNC